MKYILLLTLALLIAACASSEKSLNDFSVLNGEWVPVKLEINGQELPKAAFENQKLIIADSTYMFIAESVDKGVVKLSGNKLDIFGKDGVNAGKHFTAIYKI